MAALRRANAYSKHSAVPYTRVSKRKGKSYIKTVPQQKIVKFTMGNEPLFKSGKLMFQLTLTADERAQIRHNSLEACRQYINKQINKELSDQYLFRVVPFPHHIQREHRMLTGAGADRMSSGMVLSFGRAMGKAALVKPGKPIFFVAVASLKAVKFAREILHDVKAKLPCRTRIIFEEIKG